MATHSLTVLEVYERNSCQFKGEGVLNVEKVCAHE